MLEEDDETDHDKWRDPLGEASTEHSMLTTTQSRTCVPVELVTGLTTLRELAKRAGNKIPDHEYIVY